MDDIYDEKAPAGTLAGPEVWPPNPGDLGFHYSRAERLRTAPKIVQDYYNGGLRPVKGFRILVANKANRFMLIAMVAVIAISFGVMLFGRKDHAGAISGIAAELSAFRFGDTVYASLALKPQEKNVPMRTRLEVTFSAINNDGQVADIQNTTCFFTGTDDFLRTTFADYDIVSVTAQLVSDDDALSLRRVVQDR